jgi:hypothetical protein
MKKMVFIISMLMFASLAGSQTILITPKNFSSNDRPVFLVNNNVRFKPGVAIVPNEEELGNDVSDESSLPTEEGFIDRLSGLMNVKKLKDLHEKSIVPKKFLKEEVIPEEGQRIWICGKGKNNSFLNNEQQVKDLYLIKDPWGGFDFLYETEKHIEINYDKVAFVFGENAQSKIENLYFQQLTSYELSGVLKVGTKLLASNFQNVSPNEMLNFINNNYDVTDSIRLNDTDVIVVSVEVNATKLEKVTDKRFLNPFPANDYCFVIDSGKIFMEERYGFCLATKINNEIYLVLNSFGVGASDRAVCKLGKNELIDVYNLETGSAD